MIWVMRALGEPWELGESHWGRPGSCRGALGNGGQVQVQVQAGMQSLRASMVTACGLCAGDPVQHRMRKGANVRGRSPLPVASPVTW
jgi:hypothetical protein